MLHSLVGFLLILAPLVIVHEFGHYIFAKIFGVKAETFSIGFGPKIFSRQWGETEWKVSAIPLGGYVKLLGEDPTASIPEQDLKRALQKQKAWKRFLIFSGGPLFNFIFAIFVFVAILLIGEPQVASVIGRVVKGSAAAQAGFLSGDKIIDVNGSPVTKFEEVVLAINAHPDKQMTFKVLHPGAPAPTEVRIVPTIQEGFSVYGETTNVGEIDGMLVNTRGTKIGVSNPDSLAGRAKIKTGENVIELNGKAVESWEDVETYYASATPGAMVRFKLQLDNKDSKKNTHEASLMKPLKSVDIATDWGLHSSELFVQEAVKNSPARSVGVQSGDRLVSIGNHPIHSFLELKDAVQRAGEKDGLVKLQWEREGKMMSAEMKPMEKHGRDPLLKKVTQYSMGVVPYAVWNEPVTVIERIFNPITLIAKATERMVVLSVRNFMSIQKMFVGEVSVATLGGPILIGKLAGESLTRGLISFLTMMAILSIGLGVLNILPIPVLDGGHILLLCVETIRRKPLSMRQMEIVQGLGLSFILILMVIVMRNDLLRLF